MQHRCFIPQIPTRAGDPAAAFGADALHGQLAGFIADTNDRRPDEGIVTTALHGKVLFPKTRLGKLQSASEQRIVEVLRLA
ncbi:hypothetical protein D3C81_1790590 [compost metagenome]